MVNRERDDNVYYARLAEQGERYEDMIRYMKEVAAVSITQNHLQKRHSAKTDPIGDTIELVAAMPWAEILPFSTSRIQDFFHLAEKLILKAKEELLSF